MSRYQATPQTPVAPGARSTATPGALGTASTIPPAPTTWTMQDVVGLRVRREELSSQLNSAIGRRKDVAKQISLTPPGPARTGLEQRLLVLDERIARLERDIDITGQQLASAPGQLIAGTSSDPIQRGGLTPGQTTGVSIVFTIAVLMPLSLAFARGLLRRMGRPAALPESREMNARLENLERGMEAVAIEIERMSEGQRFVTKLLSEGAARPVDVNARAAEALRIAQAVDPRAKS